MLGIAAPGDVERFAHPASPVTRAELGFSESDIVFCYAGRLGPEKNTPLLVREFARVCSEQPHARLLVIGDGPARGDAERALADLGCGERARFLGMQPYDRLPDLEAAAEVIKVNSLNIDAFAAPESGPVATVDKRNHECGRQMIRLLLERIEGRLPPEPQCRVVEPELIVTDAK